MTVDIEPVEQGGMHFMTRIFLDVIIYPRPDDKFCPINGYIQWGITMYLLSFGIYTLRHQFLRTLNQNFILGLIRLQNILVV